jgi:hypothetical protein
MCKNQKKVITYARWGRFYRKSRMVKTFYDADLTLKTRDRFSRVFFCRGNSVSQRLMLMLAFVVAGVQAVHQQTREQGGGVRFHQWTLIKCLLEKNMSLYLVKIYVVTNSCVIILSLLYITVHDFMLFTRFCTTNITNIQKNINNILAKYM